MRFGIQSILAAAVVVGSASGALAQQKPEDTLKMRQGLFQAVKVQAGPVLGFAQGKNDMPADAAARGANVAALAKILPAAYGKGSENLPNSATKPEAFTSPDFAKGLDAMGAAAAKLAAAQDADAVKAAAGELGKTCKGCHDNFKKD